MYTECIPSVYRVYTECIPSVYRVYTECIPSVYRVYTKCIPSVYRVYIIIMRTHRVYTECTHLVYTECAKRQWFAGGCVDEQHFAVQNQLRPARKRLRNELLEVCHLKYAPNETSNRLSTHLRVMEDFLHPINVGNSKRSFPKRV